MSLEDQMISYRKNRAIVKCLEQYALGQEDALDGTDLRPAVRRELATGEGKAELRKWVNAFTEASTNMKVFDRERSMGASFNAADWVNMSLSATTLIQSLEVRLLDLALSRCKCQTASE